MHVSDTFTTNIFTTVATNVAPKVKGIDAKLTENDQSHVHVKSTDNIGHIYVNAVENNPAPSVGASLIITTFYDMRIHESTSRSHQDQDSSTTQPAYRGITYQLPTPGTTHVFNPSAPCYLSTPHVEQYDDHDTYTTRTANVFRMIKLNTIHL